MDDLRERLAMLLWPDPDWVPADVLEKDYVDGLRRQADAILDDLLTTHTITPIREPEHGTLYRYVDRKCRCDECRAANAAYSREYRAGLRREAGKHG